jgi:hypothetical protein
MQILIHRLILLVVAFAVTRWIFSWHRWIHRTVFFTGEIDIVTNRKLDGVPLRYILIPEGTHARMAKINWE